MGDNHPRSEKDAAVIFSMDQREGIDSNWSDDLQAY
jgi:hypothetical protein